MKKLALIERNIRKQGRKTCQRGGKKAEISLHLIHIISFIDLIYQKKLKRSEIHRRARKEQPWLFFPPPRSAVHIRRAETDDSSRRFVAPSRSFVDPSRRFVDLVEILNWQFD